MDLGINTPSIKYEVALENLGQGRQPFMNAIREEKAKPRPSEAFIKYCEMRLAAIDEMLDELQPEDTDTIEKIINKSGEFFRA
jgi:hypothetical protein